MIKENYFKTQNEFADKLFELTGAETKVYICLRRLVNEKKEGGNKVFCGYDYIKEKTGLSSGSIRSSIIELVKKGWIEHVDRGGENNSNKYILPDKRIGSPKSEEVKIISKKRKRNVSVLQFLNLGSLKNKEPQEGAVIQFLESTKTKTIKKTIKNIKDSSFGLENQEQEHAVGKEKSNMPDDRIKKLLESLEQAKAEGDIKKIKYFEERLNPQSKANKAKDNATKTNKVTHKIDTSDEEIEEEVSEFYK